MRILCYEMSLATRPSFDDHAYGIYEKILRVRYSAEGHRPPITGAYPRILHPDRSKRLGNLIGGPEDVLNHPWFRGVDWERWNAARSACVLFHLWFLVH